VYREYNREFLLPKGVNPEQIKSSLSKDGVLTVDAPLPEALTAGEKMIPIAHK
jgi:HSP20 family molecular chaperone IbpA